MGVPLQELMGGINVNVLQKENTGCGVIAKFLKFDLLSHSIDVL